MYRAAFAIGLSLALTGCGLIPRTGTPSTALQVADAMDVPAEDMSREEFAARLKAGRNDLGTAQGNANIDGAMNSLITRDPTMFLVSGFLPPGIARNTQIVAWVPEAMAADGKTAAAIAEKTYKKASAEVYGNTPQEKEQIETAPIKYVMGVPYGEGSPTHSVAQLYQMIAGHTPSLEPAPKFLHAQANAYGPLFLGIHGRASNQDDLEKIQRLSALLPEWFYIYSPGLAQVAPPTVLNKGSHLPFVEPQ
ncbi:hypothetical protein LRS11_15985 [Pseudomonas sp. J452]|uniref:hypothetical protein n=1 Tax=Pseudomonas sp. J452 TaxID=2898441 RepID=UPI0021ADFD95|nr:hypothetical protein [Pseudomonas sp. J452]UUY07314.1 hypothetical protein LRS11_15985 [Pseudomonas sp. J452]